MDDKGRQRQAIVLFVATVAVVVIGFFAFDLVSARDKNRVTSVASNGSSATLGKGSDGATSAGGKDDVVLLADHDATVYTELGEPVKLSDIANGQPLVLNFWATWCPYCVDELPDFQKLCAEYGNKVSFAFVDVVDGETEKQGDAAGWLKKQGIKDLPLYYDSSLEASTSFDVYALPTTVVISADGEVLTISAGRIDLALMRLSLETLV